MPDQQQLARVAVLQAAILKELHAADEDTRAAIRQTMNRGARETVWDGETAIGAVTITNPRKRGEVVDWSALYKWVAEHAPHRIITVTTDKIDPAFIRELCANGEYINADGEVLIPEGVGIVAGTPQLRVEVTDAGLELGRVLLNSVPQLPEVER